MQLSISLFCLSTVGLNQKRLYPSAALHGRVAHEIGRQIVSGAIGEGEYLPRESELAASHGVSRQAVREALKVLAAKGLVASRRRVGTSVMPRNRWNLLDPDVLAWHPPGAITPGFLSDLIELRRLIEPAAAGFAARRGGAERIARILTALEAMRANVGDEEAFFDADLEFHAALFSASGNSLIDRLSTIIGPVLQTSFHLQAKTGPSFQRAVKQHEQLYAAIAEGDSEAAHRAMEEVLMVAGGEVAQIVCRHTGAAEQAG